MYKVFYLEPTKRARLSLRRYSYGRDERCPLIEGPYSYHNASVPIGMGPGDGISGDVHSHDDPRWPKTCGCGHVFDVQDHYQLFSDLLYRRTDTGEEMTLKEAPIGAVWNTPWIARDRVYPDFGIGKDGRCLTVKTPGGEWIIDNRANNCTMPDDRTHKCWVRHGSAEDGTLHVDKNGHTCAAGAGSISLPKFHGFLHNGHLLSC